MSLMTLRKESRKRARRANKKVAPVASDARDSAMKYAESTRDWASPKVEATRDWASPKVEAAKDWASPRAEAAKEWASPRVEPAVSKVKDDVLPKVAGAVTAALAASEPVREEAMQRGSAAMAALRGEVAPPPAPRKRRMRKLLLLAGVIGAAVAGWKAWAARSRASAPEPWATPVGESSFPAATSTHPVTDDVAGASPDEALADAAEEAAISQEATPSPASENNTLSEAPAVETEQVDARHAKRVKDEAEAGRAEPNP